MNAKQTLGLVILVMGVLILLSPWFAGILWIILGGILLSRHKYGGWIYKKMKEWGIIIYEEKINYKEEEQNG